MSQLSLTQDHKREACGASQQRYVVSGRPLLDAEALSKAHFHTDDRPCLQDSLKRGSVVRDLSAWEKFLFCCGNRGQLIQVSSLLPQHGARNQTQVLVKTSDSFLSMDFLAIALLGQRK